MRKKTELQVDSKAIKDLTNGNPLILQDSVVMPEASIEEGSLLHLVDKSGGYIATGYYGIQNKGIGWVLTRKEKELIDVKFFTKKSVKLLKNAQIFLHRMIQVLSVYLTVKVTV